MSVCVNAMNDLVLDPLAGAVKIPWDTGVLCTYIYSIIYVASPPGLVAEDTQCLLRSSYFSSFFNESLFT